MLAAASLLFVSLCLFAVATATLWWMLHAWRSPEVFRSLGFGQVVAGPADSPPTFSLIVPARHEEAVLGATLDQLAALDYPAFEVLAVVGHDDPGTREVADAAVRRNGGRIRVVVDYSRPKNKPSALNTALAECRSDVVGVFDAEDEVHPRLLRQVAGAFERSGAHVVQGGVQLVNFQASWYSLRNCLEYFFWFRSRLHLHAERRFIPLGGNTVFVRTDLLLGVGGWDPTCLAEDCELGVRLSSLGARIDVAYDPMLVTREETPGTLRGLLKQRTRWNQGFLQVLRKGEWRRLPTRSQRALARYTLAMPFLQAFTGLVIPVSIYSMIALKIPVALALVSFLPVIPTLATLAFELVGLREFGRVFYMRPRAYDYVRLVLGLFPYQLFLASAAVRAVAREMFGLRGWEKTAHTGAHRPGTTATRQAAPAGALVPQDRQPEPIQPTQPALTMADRP